MKFLPIAMLVTAVAVVFALVFSVSTAFQAFVTDAGNWFWHLPQRNAIVMCGAAIILVALLASSIRSNVTRKGHYR